MTQYSVGCREQFVCEVGALQAGRQHHLGFVVLVETLRDVKCLIELLVYELPKKYTDNVSGSSKLLRGLNVLYLRLSCSFSRLVKLDTSVKLRAALAEVLRFSSLRKSQSWLSTALVNITGLLLSTKLL